MDFKMNDSNIQLKCEKKFTAVRGNDTRMDSILAPGVRSPNLVPRS